MEYYTLHPSRWNVPFVRITFGELWARFLTKKVPDQWCGLTATGVVSPSTTTADSKQDTIMVAGKKHFWNVW